MSTKKISDQYSFETCYLKYLDDTTIELRNTINKDYAAGYADAMKGHKRFFIAVNELVQSINDPRNMELITIKGTLQSIKDFAFDDIGCVRSDIEVTK